jgi:hypothetical protein
VSLFRFLPAVIAVFISAGLWVLGVSLMPAGERGGYAALECDGTVPDRAIRERLDVHGFSGIISESSQRVLLDSFGSIEPIPLDEYETRVLPFDPRNDGYAEKLRSLFVQDDRRFMYIPLGFPSVNAAGLEKRIALALEDIPYIVYHARPPITPVFSLVLFCLAAGALGFVRPVRLALPPHTACLVSCFPALAPLSLGGAAGFSLASLLAGCAVLIIGPWHDRFSRLRQLYRQQTPLLIKLLLPLLVICYGFIAFFSDLSPLFAALVFGFFGGILWFSVWSAAGDGVAGTAWNDFLSRQRGHQRFVPVPILSPRISNRRFAWVMLPFAAMAFALAFADITTPVPAQAAFSFLPPPDAVTEEDYRRHYQFQSTFSLRTLHEPFADGGMALYEFSPDGLLAQMVNGDSFIQKGFAAAPFPENAPVFPLTELLACLNTAEYGSRTVYALLTPLIPLFIIFPALVRKQKISAYTRRCA